MFMDSGIADHMRLTELVLHDVSFAMDTNTMLLIDVIFIKIGSLELNEVELP